MRTIHLLEQLAAALDVAHSNGVVHRDLKPENILIDERGNTYLTDFGIAKQIDQPSAITEADEIIGTWAYLSPEQVQAQPVTRHSDIYAFGILLYEMLTGEHPFHNVPLTVLVVKHLSEALPNIATLRPDLPTGLDNVIQKATAKDPSARYDTTLELLTDLKAAVQPDTSRIDIAPAKASVTPKMPNTIEQRNRASMLQNVRKFWIEGVLENSLHGVALLELGLKQQVNAVDHAWNTLLRTVDEPDQALPSHTPILSVFDKLNGKLLILGDPGGGKTTTLLELARDLLGRAESDEAHPIPVIFNLSSWSENHKPLVEWLVDELSSKYQVPKKVAQEWVSADALLLLLDGLDEVSLDQRDACVQAINAYRQEHGFVDVVVCSRIADYEALTNRLKLNGAMVIQPLDDPQVDRYLAGFGAEMQAVRQMLTTDTSLRELARSPLMLSIMALAYRGASKTDLPKLDTPEAQREHIFEVYVQRMFERRVSEKVYTREQTTHYLSWLAQKMQEHAQSVFQIEKLQPTWLTAEQWRNHYVGYLSYIVIQNFAIMFIASFVIALVAGLIPWLTAILIGCASIWGTWVIGSGRYQNRLLLHSSSILSGFAMAFSIGISKGFSIGVLSAIVLSFVWINANTTDTQSIKRLGNSPNYIPIVQKLRFSWSKIVMSVIIGAYLTNSLLIILITLLLNLEVSLISLAMAIFFAGLIRLPVEIYKSGLSATNVELNVRPNQGIRDTVSNAIFIAFLTGMTVMLSSIVGFAVLNNLIVGLGIGFSFFLVTATSVALAFGWQSVLQHIALRQVLYRDGAIPQSYARFLDEASALIFLRKVGGGYIFVHRYLLEYFAGLKGAEKK